MKKLIFPLILLMINFSCQDQEMEPKTNLIERTQHEINQFMLTNGFSDDNSSTINNGGFTSGDKQKIVDGIVTILVNNGGVVVSNQDMIANFNSIIGELESTKSRSSNSRTTTCEWKCSNSGSIYMGDNMYVIVSDCSDGCGNYSISNYWFEGVKLIGYNNWWK